MNSPFKCQKKEINVYLTVHVGWQSTETIQIKEIVLFMKADFKVFIYFLAPCPCTLADELWSKSLSQGCLDGFMFICSKLDLLVQQKSYCDTDTMAVL